MAQILPLTPLVEGPLILNVPIMVARDHITYLGIKSGKLPSLLYHLNFPHLIAKITWEVEIWAGLPLSLFGRAHLVKLKKHVKMLYIFAVSSIDLLIQQCSTTPLPG